MVRGGPTNLRPGLARPVPGGTAAQHIKSIRVHGDPVTLCGIQIQPASRRARLGRPNMAAIVSSKYINLTDSIAPMALNTSGVSSHILQKWPTRTGDA